MKRNGYVCACGKCSLTHTTLFGTALVKSFCEEAMTVGETARGCNRLAIDAEEDAVLLRDGGLEERVHDSSEDVVVAAFFLLGIGVLLPWNAFLSAIDYYTVLFPNISIAQYITNAYTFPFMIVGTLAAVSPALSEHRRSIIFFGLAVLIVLPAMLPVVSARDESIVNSSEAFVSKELWFTVFTSAVVGGVNAVLQSVLFGTVTSLPGGKCTTAFSAGGGVASMFIAALRILCRVLMDGDEQGSLGALRSGFQVFFITCSGLCAACIVVFLWLDRYSTYYRYHISSRDAAQQGARKTFAEVLADAKSTLADISRPAWCVLVSFVVTLALFPGILVQMPTPMRAAASPTLRTWYPLIVVSLFAIGDTVGRGGVREEVAVRYPKFMQLLTIARVAMVPVYLLQWTGILPIYWVIMMVMVTILGVGNGVIVTLAFLSVPSLTAAERREIGGRLMFVMLICGISLGNIASWILETLLRRSTEF